MTLPRGCRRLSFLFILVFLSCASVMAEMARFGEITDEEWAMGAPDALPEADVIILSDQATMEISTQSIRIDRIVRMKVLTEAGGELVGEQSIPFYADVDKIKSLRAHTITPDGKKHEVGRKAFYTSLSGDNRMKTFAFPKIEPGSILEYEYSNVTTRYRYLAPWYFQNPHYTVLSEFTVLVHNGFKYSCVSHNVPAEARNPIVDSIVNVEESGRGHWLKSYTWRRKNVLPITDEPYMAAMNNYRSALNFQLITYQDSYNYLEFVSDWQKLGKDAQMIVDEHIGDMGKIRGLAQELAQGLDDEQLMSQQLYAYVTQNIQTSYEYKDALWANESASKVIETGFGSPEEKNLLLSLMHQALGLSSHPAFIATRSFGIVWSESPDLRQFDYMVCYAQFGDSYILLDAASKYRPYGLIPPDCLVETAYLIDGDKSSLIRVSPLQLPSFRADHTRVTIDENGTASCSTVCQMGGYEGAKYAQMAERYSTEEFVEKKFLDIMNLAYDLKDHKTYLDENGHFVVELEYDLPDLVTMFDNNRSITQTSFAYRSNPFYRQKRFFPIDFQYPFTYTNIMEVELDGASPEIELPVDLNYQFMSNSFTRQSAIRDSSAFVVEKLTISDPLINELNYSSLREFFGRVVAACEDRVTLLGSNNQD